MLGSTFVGKTTLVERWCSDRFDGNIAPTYAAAFRSVPVELDGADYSFQIWDTAGQEQFSEIAPMYCRDSVGAMIVFDLTSLPSFADIPHWVDILHRHDKDIPYVLVGNKMDLPRVVTESQIDNLLAQHTGVDFIQTSAKTGDFVTDAFAQLVTIAIDRLLTPAVSARRQTENSVELSEPAAPGARTPAQKKAECC
jgi:Ras-related protein Rab-5C